MATNTLSSSKITLLAIAASRLALLSSLLHKGHGRLPHRAVLCLQLEAQEGGKNSLRQVRHWYLGEATSFKVLVNSTSSQGHGFGVPIHLEDDINQKPEMSEKGEDTNEKSQFLDTIPKDVLKEHHPHVLQKVLCARSFPAHPLADGPADLLPDNAVNEVPRINNL